MGNRGEKRINIKRSRYKKGYRYAIFGLAILLFQAYVFFIWIPHSEKKNKGYKYCVEWREKAYSGRIESKKGTRIVYYFSNDGRFSRFPDCPEIRKFVSVGDSLYKPSTSFDLYVYKGANPDSLIYLPCEFDCESLKKK